MLLFVCKLSSLLNFFFFHLVKAVCWFHAMLYLLSAILPFPSCIFIRISCSKSYPTRRYTKCRSDFNTGDRWVVIGLLRRFGGDYFWRTEYMGKIKIYVLKVGCDTSLAAVRLGILLLWKELFYCLARSNRVINPLNPELNPMCCLLALLGAHHFLHVSRIRVKSLTFRRLMSYIYGAPILDVSRSHTTTQHSR